MKRIATWKSLDNKQQTLENCRIRKTETGFLIESVINGIVDDFPTYCAYKIRTDEKWETKEFTIYTWIGWEEHTIYMTKNNEVWESKQQPKPECSDCVDIDISVTPFTNTLPINRLKLKIGETAEIKVLYIDIAKQTVEPKAQRYTRLTNDTYQYEDAVGNFKAQITVDDEGLVTQYPPLFQKI